MPVRVKVRAVIWINGRVVVSRQQRLGVAYVTLPGGRVSERESVIDALSREVLEDVGLEIKIGDLLLAAEVVSGATHQDVELLFEAWPRARAATRAARRGRVSVRRAPPTIFAAGPHGWLPLLVAFVLSGSGIGLAETAESTLVAETLPDRLRGSGFGLLGGLQAAGDLAASVIVGLIWSIGGPEAAFLYAAAWMVCSLLASALVVPSGSSG